MKNLIIILVLFFSSLSFSQKVLTTKDFPVRINISEKGRITMLIPTNDLIQLSVYKVSKNGKELIESGEYNIAFETSFPLEKGNYMIKVIKNKKLYVNKFSVN